MSICLYPIIIGGFYRSGTSLLRRLLDSHSNIHCGPEVKFFKDFYGDYLHDELSHVRFFHTLKALGLDEYEMMATFGKAFIASHELAARKRGKKRWADKNPENVLYLRQWHWLLEGKLFFVHVVRHPLDALASLAEAGFNKAVPAEFDGKLKLFRQFSEKALSYTECNPDTSVLIRYEELVTNTENTLSGLLDKLGETFEPSVIEEFASTKRQVGIEDPKIIRTSEIHSRSIGRWRQDLNNGEVQVALEELGPILSRLQYDVEDA